MADIDYDDYGAPPRMTGGQAQRLVHLTGAACSIALIVGVGLWGYRLAVRDVTGVPVIRAAEGPMRVAPSNPGGDIADHQGMAVNVVAAAGGAAPLPEEIILAPAPVELSAEDAPGLSPLDPMSDAVASAPSAGEPPMTEAAAASALAVATLETPDPLTSVPDAGANAPTVTEDAVAMALAEALGDAMPLAPLADLPEEAALPEADAAVAEGPAGSLRPKARPQTGLQSAPTAEPVSVAVSVGPEIDSTTLTAGTRLVQLGAFDSPEIARAEWIRLRERFGDLMTGKSLVVQSAQSGGRTFYRLRAHGFDGEDDARRFCAALLAENAACIPVAHR
ncbi:SPOR domain-containing protein [Pseudotabrizicola alkalilacus]|uniref:SPOR domain-containing protein n=1 Tax=Pseudotabrizicola alkalilacus TaxID=2305252 RepID=A0A411Z3Z2_9RHOB|nr:SPOR domain-containing protein [Pseudotabrizicola alkalilacus]RGP37750.1 SPOR domain-containing protein [Pseudotabrizicola alkalilacus]